MSTMKKLFLLLLVLPLAFYACGDDDSKEPKEPTPEELDKMTIEEYMSKDRPFKWNGDWNDAKDPNYKKEGYNPIEGFWIADSNPIVVFRFSEDHKYSRYDYDKEAKTLKNPDYGFKYVINNRVFRFNVTGNEEGESHSAYGLNNTGKILYLNQLILNPTVVKTSEWKTYTWLDISDITIID